jgi:hypothetical protein
MADRRAAALVRPNHPARDFPTTVTRYPYGGPRTVTNLGWLLRHAAQVTAIRLQPTSDGGCNIAADVPMANGTLDVYRTHFNMERIAHEWLTRPSLSHASITIVQKENEL